MNNIKLQVINNPEKIVEIFEEYLLNNYNLYKKQHKFEDIDLANHNISDSFIVNNLKNFFYDINYNNNDNNKLSINLLLDKYKYLKDLLLYSIDLSNNKNVYMYKYIDYYYHKNYQLTNKGLFVHFKNSFSFNAHYSAIVFSAFEEDKVFLDESTLFLSYIKKFLVCDNNTFQINKNIEMDDINNEEQLFAYRFIFDMISKFNFNKNKNDDLDFLLKKFICSNYIDNDFYKNFINDNLNAYLFMDNNFFNDLIDFTRLNNIKLNYKLNILYLDNNELSQLYYNNLPNKIGMINKDILLFTSGLSLHNIIVNDISYSKKDLDYFFNNINSLKRSILFGNNDFYNKFLLSLTKHNYIDKFSSFIQTSNKFNDINFNFLIEVGHEVIYDTAMLEKFKRSGDLLLKFLESESVPLVQKEAIINNMHETIIANHLVNLIDVVYNLKSDYIKQLLTNEIILSYNNFENNNKPQSINNSKVQHFILKNMINKNDNKNSSKKKL